ncbi:sugar ABC transporter ATP-binding protein [Oceanotoga sp. DSM 15011]|uniref:sugar ABC transporter ATP-binding protein n=1 Tax=Oceanotoga sp. DSM 15011 TaxID=2984951 RepID=UPI0021F4873F|nr:sugar ABC transporter ATP-binding protein [Oceanotoga sp. DSM 15011]UYO99583.1 sugar ABC transporter ATP-binding protein [Oceanotoga sp. DSM 15011]
MNEKVPLLKLENISKDFFGNKVLNDINLTIEQGEIIGLVGENGAGKSTMMNIIFGSNIIKDTGGYGGKIYLNGSEINFNSSFDALDAGIGMVHQEFSLIPGFTAYENIVFNREDTKYNFMVDIFGDRLSTLNRSKMKERAEKAIKTLEVNVDINMLVNEMPVGHKQFTEIAREIDRKNTKILVLDEPTAVLTESEADILLKTIKKLSKKGISIIFISHRLKEILDISDKIVVLRDGELIKEVSPSDTSIHEISEWMVGRSLEKKEKKSIEERKFENIIFKTKKLWVDMPGETVRDVSLEIYEGEIFGIGGLAGQGKLGIANGIMGLYPAGGYAEFRGQTLHLNDALTPLKKGLAFVSEDRRGVGLLLDEPIDLNIGFTAMNIQEKFIKKLFGGLLKWRDDESLQNIANEYINSLEIKCTSEKQKAKELSGGNQQKVCLAKSFALKPDLLFVSEPTRGIDVGAKQLVLDTLKKYNKEYGTTIIIASSELEELRSICDRISIVNEGKIAGILSPKDPIASFGELMVGNVSTDSKKVSNV